jgi:DNA-binding CsgD family transcriptional regulator
MFRRYKLIIFYGLALALLLFVLKWLEWRFIIFDHALELYSGALALLFTALGIWLALKLARPKVKTLVVEKEVIVTREIAVPAVGATEPVAAYSAGVALAKDPAAAEAALARLGVSQRELEVLQLMAEGLSNQEIAARLFVSLNTVKTHSQRLFEKLDVRRRTQAVETGRKLQIIA